ncbi:MAG: hypothetical protein HYY59_02735 [Candidatus Omnitrophica bacterium]|nr:hypothetical protein [Candidatus Omnitrophota bacterium]
MIDDRDPGQRGLARGRFAAPLGPPIAARFLSLAPPAASGWAERGLCVRGGQGAPHPAVCPIQAYYFDWVSGFVASVPVRFQRWVWGEPSTQRREATTLGSPTVRASAHPEHSRRGTVAAPKTELPLTDRLATRCQ